MNIALEPKFIVGVDFGAVSSEVSIAHVDDPFNIYTVHIWGQVAETSINHPRRFHTSIMYIKDGEKKILCGAHSPYVGPEDTYIPSIKQYLFDLASADEKLGQMKEGLTIQTVVTDYLECFIKLALERLQAHVMFRQSAYFQSDYDLDNVSNIRYRVACPKSLQTFMANCFIDAGIIEEHEKKHRLSFVTDVEATAYDRVSLDRDITKLVADQSYLLCDVGEISIGIAKVKVDTTESMSTVELIYENSDNGSTHLEVKFRKYLEENSHDLHLDPIIIENLVAVFLRDIKYNFHECVQRVSFSVLNTEHNPISIPYVDLSHLVFLPVIEDIIQHIAGALKAHGDCKLILSGKYAADIFFNQKLKERLNNNFVNENLAILEESYLTVSSGAVSSALRPSNLQTPFATSVNPAQPMLDNHDYGTAYSGCSYVNLKNGLNTIKTIFENWPGGSSVIFGKTPTLLTRDKKNKTVYWGEEAKLKACYNKHLTLFDNFKVLLCPENKERSNENNLSYFDFSEEPKSPGEEKKEIAKKQDYAVSIISSYLQVFKNHVLEYIIDRETDDTFTFYNKGKLLKKYKVKYVITVPAMWGSQALEIMTQAAIDATIIKENERDNLLIITEPEAAALSCEKKFNEFFDKPDGTNFIVCDAGAGTVDLLAFQLDAKEQLDEFDDVVLDSSICAIGGKGIGDMCGSNYLNVLFKNYLVKFYSDMGVDIHASKVNFDSVIQNFESYQKNNFMPSTSADSYYDIPLPVRIPSENIEQSSQYVLVNNDSTLRMSNKDMQVKVFDPIMDTILDLLYRKKRQAEANGNQKIEAILLFGGFSQSKYLKKRISDEFQGKCAVHVPYNNATAISHGAVTFGLNPCMVVKGYAGQSLALEVQAPFEKTDIADSMCKIVNGPHGMTYAKNCLDYFVKLDQELHNGQCSIYTKEVYIEYPKEAVIAIFSCDSREDSDSRFVTSSHKKILEARVVTPPTVTGIEKGEIIQFKVSLQMKGSSIHVRVECRNALINDNIKVAASNEKLSLVVENKCTLNVLNKKPIYMHPSMAKENAVYGLRVNSPSR
ncbi:hypothetical protein INT47_002751 [Mucor saturninus]|uniref:Heat shock protein 70 n=1 Tax=Mucor saturninus TaxID=64648 RepID=A0A8H7V074_9FUNG|nr:hypothetical protein INT47_002751 [Mucor saturninus]